MSNSAVEFEKNINNPVDNPALSDLEAYNRRKTENILRPLFKDTAWNAALPYPIPNSEYRSWLYEEESGPVPYLTAIPALAFNACLDAAFNGNYNLGLSILDIERDLARCFLYVQKGFVDWHVKYAEGYFKRREQDERERYERELEEAERRSKREEAEREREKNEPYREKHDAFCEDVEMQQQWELEEQIKAEEEEKRSAEAEYLAEKRKERIRAKAEREARDRMIDICIGSDAYFEKYPERRGTYEYDYENWKRLHPNGW